jgi:glycosyltransferase involved in cell wall biosynthesis
MRILVLMKRFGAGKDMVMENFGRQIRLFENIAKDHDVVPDYKKLERKDLKLAGMNFYVRPYSILRHLSFIFELEDLIRKNRYDAIVGTTDPVLGIIAVNIGKKYGIKTVYDMQDEYSCYSSYKIPLVKSLDRAAVADADVVLTVSDSLHKHVNKFRQKKTITIQNGIDLKLFKKHGKESSRKKLGLPKGRIIVYAGEISKFKGVDVLVDAFCHIRKDAPDSYLLLSGPVADVNVYKEGIIYRKFAKREDLAMALNAADVAVLPNPDSMFSRFCFPYKLLEYMSAGLPIVATDFGDVRSVLKDKGSMCSNDAMDMALKISKKLKSGARHNYRLKGFEWKTLSKKLMDGLK